MDAALDELMMAGEKRGEARGEDKGEANLSKLGIMLTEVVSTDDFLKSLSNKELQRKLFIEFGRSVKGRGFY